MEPKDVLHATPYELWKRAEVWEKNARDAQEELVKVKAECKAAYINGRKSLWQAEALDNLFSELPGKLCFGELTDWLAERADKYRRQAEEDDIEGKMQDLLHQRG